MNRKTRIIFLSGIFLCANAISGQVEDSAGQLKEIRWRTPGTDEYANAAPPSSDDPLPITQDPID